MPSTKITTFDMEGGNLRAVKASDNVLVTLIGSEQTTTVTSASVVTASVVVNGVSGVIRINASLKNSDSSSTYFTVNKNGTQLDVMGINGSTYGVKTKDVRVQHGDLLEFMFWTNGGTGYCNSLTLSGDIIEANSNFIQF